jgi:hypothetical protein
MFTPLQPASVVKIAPVVGGAIRALAAVTINSVNAANAINVIRDVRNLDLREREFKFVFISGELLVVPV